MSNTESPEITAARAEHKRIAVFEIEGTICAFRCPRKAEITRVQAMIKKQPEDTVTFASSFCETLCVVGKEYLVGVIKDQPLAMLGDDDEEDEYSLNIFQETMSLAKAKVKRIEAP